MTMKGELNSLDKWHHHVEHIGGAIDFVKAAVIFVGG